MGVADDDRVSIAEHHFTGRRGCNGAGSCDCGREYIIDSASFELGKC